MPSPKKSASVTKSKPKSKPTVDPPAVKKEPKAAPNYEILKWNKKDMFQCLHCPWSTLDEDEMVLHIAKHFSSTAPSVRRTDTGFVTVTGDKIIREEIVEPANEDKEV